MSEFIYLDNAATTAVRPEVVEAMMPYLTEVYSNPSSVYSFAGKAKKAMEAAREQIAGFVGAKPAEIYFTGGGSESDNWALKRIIEKKENILLRPRLSTMLCSIPVNGWRKTDMR